MPDQRAGFATERPGGFPSILCVMCRTNRTTRFVALCDECRGELEGPMVIDNVEVEPDV